MSLSRFSVCFTPPSQSPRICRYPQFHLSTGLAAQWEGGGEKRREEERRGLVAKRRTEGGEKEGRAVM